MERSADDLYAAAYALACEVHDGKWTHVGVDVKPLRDCYPALTEELRARCPGHHASDYEQLLAKALHEAMF